ncbi:glycosyltransferase [Aureispira anguillae]|uniref:Glycosyltransferase n=1 Tax=Aureispira anguillae TaxID=2864201 RepID=A0A915YHV1_9BACT|nr:glycosyltransferase [Aureispira anguillae]BDS13472.1 glycosyltransferase [Aureispira anguillae]
MLLAYSTLSILLIIGYLVIISSYIYYWNKLEVWNIPPHYTPKTTVTVIVAARNEALHIVDCLEALLAQDYPTHLLQIWVVNDHSEDNTADLVKAYSQNNLYLLNLPSGKMGKKQAIQAAIEQSKGQLIVTTDADCIMDKEWLTYLVSYYERHQTKFIAAPVSFYKEKSLFERFQSLDFMGMMAVAGAGVKGQFMNMCNGANLAYERRAFEAVNGFDGINHIASGDDMLLMQKIATDYPNQIGYLKNPNCQTLTYAKPSLKSFMQQRIRWASKSDAYTGWQVLAMLATVWILCISMFLDLLLMPFHPVFLLLFVLKFGFKGIADFFFLRMMTIFFNRPQLMRVFIPSLFLHWWYIAIIGSLGNFVKRYEWKNRRVS